MTGGIIRRLVAVIGLDFKRNEFDRAELGIQKLKTTLNTVVGLFAGSMIARGMIKLVESASDVNETLNVLDQAFGDSSAGVQQWASDLAGPIGRSQYMLREFAGSTGAIIEPILGSKEAAAEMSTNFAQLAIDLGSFFNANDEDALQALQSGIVGQSEPLRRFGVVLLESTLQEYAHAKGIGKKVQQMSEAEKVQLRYQYIMEKTKTAQGDAIRTADGYANASKALKGALRDAAVALGAELLPMVNGFVQWATKAVRSVFDWLKGTNILSHAFQVLAAAAGVAAFILSAKLLAALGGVALMAAKAAFGLGVAGNAALLMQLKAMLFGAAFILVFALLFGLWDEFRTMMEGGDTLFGRLSDKISELYDTFVNMDLSDSPILRAIRWMVTKLKDAKDIAFALIMAMKGDFSGLNMLSEDREKKRSVEGPGAVERLVRGVTEYVDNNLLGGGLGRTKLAASGAVLMPTQVVAASTSTYRAGGVTVPSVTINQVVNPAPGQDEVAVGRAAGKSASDAVQSAIEDASVALLPLTPGASGGW